MAFLTTRRLLKRTCKNFRHCGKERPKAQPLTLVFMKTGGPRPHRKPTCNRPLIRRERHGSKSQRSKVRARGRGVFGGQTNDLGGALVRSIGISRAKARIGLKNLAYNMRRVVQLNGLAAARGPT